jgi:hypothetical protein
MTTLEIHIFFCWRILLRNNLLFTKLYYFAKHLLTFFLIDLLSQDNYTRARQPELNLTSFIKASSKSSGTPLYLSNRQTDRHTHRHTRNKENTTKNFKHRVWRNKVCKSHLWGPWHWQSFNFLFNFLIVLFLVPYARCTYISPSRRNVSFPF